MERGSDSLSPPPASSPDAPLATAAMQAAGHSFLQPRAASPLPEPEAAAELSPIVFLESLNFSFVPGNSSLCGSLPCAMKGLLPPGSGPGGCHKTLLLHMETPVLTHGQNA